MTLTEQLFADSEEHGAFLWVHRGRWFMALGELMAVGDSLKEVVENWCQQVGRHPKLGPKVVGRGNLMTEKAWKSLAIIVLPCLLHKIYPICQLSTQWIKTTRLLVIDDEERNRGIIADLGPSSVRCFASLAEALAAL